MGADLIGYFLYMPADAKVRNKIFKEHIQKIKNLTTPSLAIINDTENEDVWKNLNELGVATTEYTEFDDEQGALESFLGDLKELENGFEWPLCARDLANQILTINGMKVEVCFAGEMSWGDDPSGAGYQLLKLLNNLGFYEAFYNAIPWDLKTKKKRKK